MRRLRVLVADDNELLRGALVRVLGAEFDVIRSVADGGSLIDAALSSHPDVIVSDVCMPMLTGPEAMCELRRRGHRIPFVFVSSTDEFIPPCTWSFVCKMKMTTALAHAVRNVVSEEN